MCLGIPARILSLVPGCPGQAMADCGGVQRQVDISCVLEGQPPEALIDRWVVVHVGFALARLREEEAQASLAVLAQLQAQLPDLLSGPSHD